jgi:hypothetical protein
MKVSLATESVETKRSWVELNVRRLTGVEIPEHKILEL